MSEDDAVMIVNDEIAVLMECRAFIYKLFQCLSGMEPTSELLSALRNDDTRVALDLLCGDRAEYGDIYTELCAAAETHADDLRGEYTRHFIGPRSLIAPPWESVYRSDEHLLFDKNTLKVREIYKDNGYIPEGYPSVADDHLALELDFMRLLAERLLLAYEAADRDSVYDLYGHTVKFLNEHLLVWVPEYSRRLQGHGVFYPLAGLLLCEVLKADKTLLELMRGVF